MDFKETAVNWLNADGYATFSSSEQKWISKINKLHEQFPDEVSIEYAPESNCGMLLAHIPKSWIKIKPPARRNMTEEQRKEIANRLANGRSKL